MPTPTKRERVHLLLLLFFVIFSLALIWSFKNQIAFFFIKKGIEHVFAGSQFSCEGVVVNPGFLEIKHFEITNPHQTIGLVVQEGRLVIKFSTPALLKNPVLAIKEVALSVGKGRYGAVGLQGLALHLISPPGAAHRDAIIRATSLSYNDIKANQLKGHLKVKADSVDFDHMDILLWGGKVACEGNLSFENKNLAINLRSHLESIHLEDMIKAFRLEKRFQITGVFDGEIRLAMANSSIRDLSGSLHSSGGGQFLITDKSFNSQELLKFKGSNILVENLENYYYDIGNVTVKNDGQDVWFEMTLDGKAGRRHLEVIWHRGQNNEEVNDEEKH